MAIRTEEMRASYSAAVSKIKRGLSRVLAGKRGSLYESCSYILNGGGKRLRPFLVLTSAEATGGKSVDVYNAAIAVELLHNATLVHDDIMDDGDRRHGRITLNKKYGVNTAILAGDTLFALAYEHLLRNWGKDAREVFSVFTQGIIRLCEGQSLDGEFESRRNVSIPEYKDMIYKKTASFAEMCCSIGAQLGGASRQHTRAVSNYGKFLGMAFQIQDDLLDITAKDSKFGKTVGKDITRGKKTYVFLRALKKARGADRDYLLKVTTKRGASKKEIVRCRGIYRKLGVLEDAKKEVRDYTDLALRSLSPLPDNRGKETLARLAEALLSRNK